MRSASGKWAAAVLMALAARGAVAGEFGSERQARVRLVVQNAVIAGLRHYEAPSLWPQLRPGLPLRLVREPENPHDPHAVRVEALGRTIGYLRRQDNPALAWAIDSGRLLAGRLSSVDRHRNGRGRLEVEIYVD